MQQLDALTLKHLAIRLNQDYEAAKLNKVQQPAGSEFLFGFWGGMNRQYAQKYKLYVNLHPAFPVCMPVTSAESESFLLPTLTKPTGFCMLLRKHLMGAVVLNICSLPGERVIHWVFENFNELGNKVRFILALELMGKQSNMILVDDVQGIMLGAAHLVTADMSRYREVASGLPYVPPPKPAEKTPFSQVPVQEFLNGLESHWKQGKPAVTAWLTRRLWGMNDRLSGEITVQCNTPAEIYRLMTALEGGENLHPAISADWKRYTLSPPIPRQEGIFSPGVEMTSGSANWIPQDDVVPMVRCYALHHLRENRLGTLRQSLLSAVQTPFHKLEQRIQELSQHEEEDIDLFQRAGDAVFTAISMGERPGETRVGSHTAMIYDWVTENMLALQVDPVLTWRENALRFYQKAKKARNRKNLYEQQIRQIQERMTYLLELRQLVSQAETLADLLTLREDLAQAGLCKSASLRPDKKEKEGAAMAGIYQTRSSDGFPVWVGKSSQGNALLVGKWAKGEDIWLHVHQMPGSHVLIKTGKQPCSDQALLDAANLAVYYSAARDGNHVPVLYTEAKYVRKIPDSYPGHVTYKQEKTVFITVQEDLIDRLLHPVQPEIPENP